LSFQELVEEDIKGKKNYCYAINKQGSISIAPILNPRITKKNAQVIKIILDNKEEIVCTPDHLFMLKDNSFKKAEKLTTGDSLKYHNNNHSLKQIVNVEERVDVYDIEVPEYHNFALASGVFVHNSAKQGRDRAHQAILPLGGKILNTERARLDKIIEFEELKDLIVAMGMGIGETLDPAKLRYHRIIIMTDADVDGAHIATLLLTFFYRHTKPVVEQGHIYLAMPPLYKIAHDGKEIYVYSDPEKEAYLATLTPQQKQKVNLQRYKGLGEMNPEQLWDTTMNPATRTLKKVSIEDAEKADEVFSTLMGADVAPRKKFIQTHATDANLDI